jgi:hypothetical protein
MTPVGTDWSREDWSREDWSLEHCQTTTVGAAVSARLSVPVALTSAASP